jgi:surfeit locus 1 family protein
MPLRSRSILALGFLAVAAICARLGVWQVNRLKERRAANTVALAARMSPVVDIGGGGLTPSLINRRVRVVGRYDHAHDIVLRGREYRGVPGVEIVSPLLRQTGSGAILVDRGFVPAPDAVSADPRTFQEPGPIEVQGIALPLDSAGGAPLQRGEQATFARLDRAAISTRLPYPVEPLYIRQTPDSALPRFPRRLPAPELNDGPHLSYAIQWFAFSVIALIFAGIMWVKGERSGVRSEQ